MGSSTAKKILIERFDRVMMRGFAQALPASAAEALELITPDGAALTVPLDQIKAVCFVRDLEGPSIFKERKEFLSRPKSHGLWVEARFTDGSRLEGMIANNLNELNPPGYALTPPEIAGNTQRVWIPQTALAELVVLGVVGTPKRTAVRRGQETRQIKLFGETA
ncbi:MAG: hypothetical protein C0504_17375 [Candidatus Solibacter sp.]|nr:hypothetical protein [Candidatus Solibacter sp.]